MSRRGKVVVAMSGGVDSSVVAALLKEQGYECVGVFMRVGVAHKPGASALGTGSTDAAVHTCPPSPVPTSPLGDAPTSPPSPLPPPSARRPKHGCCSVEDALDARAIAGRLGIPFYVLNFQADFDRIIDYFVDEYARARTPNPCVVCNTQLKFGKLLRYADAMDAEYVATGHYARVMRGNVRMCDSGNAEPGGATEGLGNSPAVSLPNPRPLAPSVPWPLGPSDPSPCFLARARNLAKDQSYVLFGIRRDDLARCLFPLGEIADKAEVRCLAADLGLNVHDKPESQEICFVPDGDYRRLVRERRPEVLQAGEIRDAAGNVLGTHAGMAGFTIGQRRGLRLAAGHPIYVTKLDAATNTVTIGPRDDLLRSGLVAEQINWLVAAPPANEWRPAEIKIRHQHTPVPGRVRTLDNQCVEARFDVPQSAVTPGQAAVFYGPGGIVLGGGWIARPSPV